MIDEDEFASIRSPAGTGATTSLARNTVRRELLLL